MCSVGVNKGVKRLFNTVAGDAGIKFKYKSLSETFIY